MEFVFVAVNHMQQGQDGMAGQHSWAGVSHDLANVLAHLGFMTVDVALGARPLR